MILKIKDRVRLINGIIATIVDIKNEPISLNKVYLIDKQYKGKYDDEYGYNREYYKEEHPPWKSYFTATTASANPISYRFLPISGLQSIQKKWK